MKMNGLYKLTALSALLLVAAAPLACGGGDTTGTGGAGGSGSTTNTTSTSTTGSSSSMSSSGMTSSSSGMVCMDDPAPCLAMAVDPCGMCACNNCLCQLNDCNADMGCLAIRMCAQMAMCSGIGCYMPGTCMMVIDQNGGPTGPSATLGLALSQCTEMACATECPP